jgi:quinol monooxygenase YgiN
MNIIVKRTLKNYDEWKKVLSTLNEARKEKGSKGLIVYRNAKAPNEVYLVLKWDDQKPYMDYFNLPDVQKALADTGTTEIIEVSEIFHLEA